MYSVLPNLVLAFHGCDEETFENVLDRHEPLRASTYGNTDLLYRDLDCAVIERIHQYNKENEIRAFDNVRGVFPEDEPVYANAGIKEKTHIQLCVGVELSTLFRLRALGRLLKNKTLTYAANMQEWFIIKLGYS